MNAKPIGRFVILAAPRSGSNLLCTLLDSHPQITCHHEIFNPRGIFYALDRRTTPMSADAIRKRDEEPDRFLESFWKTGESALRVGFKMTAGQNEDVMRQVLADPTISKILLFRKNRVRSYLSDLIAEHTDQWEVYDENDLVREVPQPTIDPNALRRHSQANATFRAGLKEALSNSGQSWLELAYSDLLTEATHRQVLRYLGVAPVALTPRSIRQNCADLRTSIANFNELALALNGTEFEAELHEAREMTHEN